jgi:glutaconyl-CoA/methylmalonyl-CoA decarboxylase subunit gamma
MHRYEITVDGVSYSVDIDDLGPQHYRVQLNGRDYDVTLNSSGELSGISSAAAPALPVAAAAPPAAAPLSRPAATPTTPTAGAADIVRAPMPGTVLSVSVSIGQRVTRGQPLLVLEAMKMNNSIGAPQDGTIAAVLVEPGRNVAFGEPLIRLE